MTSLLSKIAQIARGPKGRRLAEKAKTLTDDPKHHNKIDEARQRLAKRDATPSETHSDVHPPDRHASAASRDR